MATLSDQRSDDVGKSLLWQRWVIIVVSTLGDQGWVIAEVATWIISVLMTLSNHMSRRWLIRV